jgi:hypothetical protein
MFLGQSFAATKDAFALRLKGGSFRSSIHMNKAPENYGERESRERFEAALRGARDAQAHPMKDIPRKRKRTKKAQLDKEEKESER